MGKWIFLIIMVFVLVVLPVGIFLQGFQYFFKGWKRFARYRFLRDTPRERIRACALGLVHVRGKAKWTEATASPGFGVPSLFSVVEIDEVGTDPNGKTVVRRLTTDNDVRRFWLEDESGRILVDAPQASINFATSSSVITEALNEIKLSNFREVKSLRPYVDARISAIEHSALPATRKRELMNQALDLGRRADGFYHLKEQCIGPGQELSAIGTCVPHPDPHDPVRLMLTRGAEGSTFEVSGVDLHAEVGKLRWKAYGLIYGGALQSLGIVAAAIYVIDHVGKYFHWSLP
jgi:hypothetical protein